MPASTVIDAPAWVWIITGAAIIATGLAVILFRLTRSQEETIRRQLAREASLKARLDDVFERSSEIFIIHDRRGRVSTTNRSGEEVTAAASTRPA